MTEHAESQPRLSLVFPAFDEADNLDELIRTARRIGSRLASDFEIVIVDDGSTDDTRQTLRGLLATHHRLRAVALEGPRRGHGSGQSAAFHAGFRIAAADLIAGIDADGQNAPAEIPRLLREMRETGADLIQGDRSGTRCDSFARRAASGVGRVVRRAVLDDRVRDTGCSLRVFRRELGLALPLQYQGMHRFIPIYARMLGYRVLEVSVQHRARVAGQGKYGIWNRALPGLIDLFAVRWMRRRLRDTSTRPIERMD